MNSGNRNLYCLCKPNKISDRSGIIVYKIFNYLYIHKELKFGYRIIHNIARPINVILVEFIIFYQLENISSQCLKIFSYLISWKFIFFVYFSFKYSCYSVISASIIFLSSRRCAPCNWWARGFFHLLCHHLFLKWGWAAGTLVGLFLAELYMPLIGL